MSAAETATLAASRSSKKTSSMNNIVDASCKQGDNGNRDDELLGFQTKFVSLRKKSADDLLNIVAGEPFVLSQGLSFTSGSILQSVSPPLGGRRSPSPVPPPPTPSSSAPGVSVSLPSPPAAVSTLLTNEAAMLLAASMPDAIGYDAGSESQLDAAIAVHTSTSSTVSAAIASSTNTTVDIIASGRPSSASTTSAALSSAATTTTSTSTSASSGPVAAAPVAIPVKAPSKVSERAKKKAWYSVLYPSYKSRSEDFKKLFKGVPDDERLVVDYSCAVQRDILVHGRLYVSQNYLCFYANIFRWETCLSIRWKDVTAISKEKTALVIPNAILVSTISEKYFITSFTSRDKAYMMLFRVWQNALMDKPMLPQEMWKWVHNSYGDELGLTSDDEDYIDPYEDRTDAEDTAAKAKTKAADSVSEDLSEPQSDTALQRHMSVPLKAHNGGRTKLSKHSSSSTTASPMAQRRTTSPPSAAPSVALPVIGAGAAAVAVASSTAGSLSKPPHRKPVSKPNARKLRNSNGDATTTTTTDGLLSASATASGGGGGSSAGASPCATACEQLPTDMSDSSDSESGITIPPFVCTAECTSMHEGRQLVHTILPINVDTLFALLFSKSKFLVDFHAHRKTTNMVHEDWQTDSDGAPCRKVNLTVALTQAVGPKCSHVTEHQVQRACSDPAQLYSIDITSTNAGIPYADSFYVFMHYCLVRTVDDHTMFSVHAQVKYKKSVWGVVKGFIEKNTWAGLEDFYTALLRALQSEYCIPPAKAKGRRPRGRGNNSLPRNVQPGEASGVADGAFALCSSAAAAKVATGVGAHAATTASTLTVTGFGGGGAGGVGGGGGGVLSAGCAQSVAACQLLDDRTKVGGRGGSRWTCTTLTMLLVVGALLLVNVILLLNLWRLQGQSGDSRSSVGIGGGGGIDFDAEFFDFRLLKNSPKSSQEWIELLKRQEALHATETNKWQSILQTAVKLLRKTEQTLSDLLSLIDMKDFPPHQYSTTSLPTIPVTTDEANGAGAPVHGEL